MLSSLFIRKALISVADKSDLLQFAQSLFKSNITLLSSAGTAKILSKFGVPVLKISDYTQIPEIMDGRIKTLHHKIYAGILKRKNIDDDIMNKYKIQPIDMVVVNFYPFDSAIINKKYSQEEILEYIDIGGPSMVRAAAKNYKNIVTVIHHDDYKKILDEMKNNNGSISLKTRFTLAVKAFQYISDYDTMISKYFENQLKNKYSTHTKRSDNIKCNKNHHYFPNTLTFMNSTFTKKQNIRYGENPHQQAAFYTETHLQNKTGYISTSQQLQGKSLSYNNIIDLDTALECVKMFPEPTCVIVKHANPCGVATSNTISIAYQKAYQADPISAFGGIVAINRSLDKKIAQEIIIKQQFIEAIIAPNIDQDCLNILSNKKNIIILICGPWKLKKSNTQNFQQIKGGLLVQDYNYYTINNKRTLDIVTIHKPTQKDIENALFCWKIVKFVKSNAIVCGKNYQTTGIGAGQMNRIYSTKIATHFFTKTPSEKIKNIQGSAMASDGFLPFNDNIQVAAKMGIRCIIQPGGSIKDQEIIKSADAHQISMIFTRIRNFRH